MKAIANLTGRHVIVLRMSKIKTGSELKQIFNDPMVEDKNISTKRRLYVFEEFDVNGQWSVLRQRGTENTGQEPEIIEELETKLASLMKKGLTTAVTKGVTEDDHVTLGLLLELLDGLVEYPGRMVIMTTNRRDQLDSALLRPGKTDTDGVFFVSLTSIIIMSPSG